MKRRMSVWGRKPDGFIQMAEGYYMAMQKKPCVWHRFWMRVFLGWRWVDKAPLCSYGEGREE